MTKNYKLVEGTSYSENTPTRVIEWLERSRRKKWRIRVFYGNRITGKDWKEKNDVMGVIGRSTGTVKIPLLIKNSSSYGGDAVLDDCIVKITVDKKTVYQHENYHLYKKSIGLIKSGDGYEVCIDDEIEARFKTKEKAENYILFLKGERNKI